jgi:Zn-dependent M16 (insulinase) family peptidase
MKRNRPIIILALLALVLLFSCSTTKQTTESTLPHIDDKIAGFVVKEVTPMESLGGTGILYEHEKSGAHLLYIKNDDINRSFTIAFKTPALNDKGIPHIFEHITLGGSAKYPDPNITFPFFNQTYNTYTNALTHATMTCFLGASLSEDQLLSIADYNLSGVFHPLLYTDPRLKDREAWRYEIKDAESPITIAGTVYSEMRGNMNMSMLGYTNTIKTLYEGSKTAYVSGGVPDSIRTTTYEDLTSFHDTYYHPSNALIILYGKLDIGRFLSFFDSEYLSKYDRKTITVEKGTIAPFAKTNEKTFLLPVEKNAKTDDASEISYSFACNGITAEETCSLDMIVSILDQDSSILKQNLREKFPNANIFIFNNFDSPSAPYICITADGVNEKDKDVFVSTVDASIHEMLEKGIDEKILESIKTQQKLSNSLLAENNDLGVSASRIIALFWSYSNSVDYFPVQEKAIGDMTAEKAEEMMRRYLEDNRHRGVTITKPAAGLAEENDAALTKELSDKKAKMTKDEVIAMVQKGKEFQEWATKPVDETIIKELVSVTPSSLPEEIEQYDITDKTSDGIRYITSNANVNDIVSNTILLDASTIPVDKLQDVMTYLTLLGQLDTKEHTKEELSTLLTRYLGGMFLSDLSGAKGYKDAQDLYLASYNWISLGEDVPEAFALVKEILHDTDFSNTDDIRDILQRNRLSFQQALDNNILYVQMNRAGAMLSSTGAFNTYLTGYAMDEHRKMLLDLDPQQLTARMEDAGKFVNNRTNAIVCIVGDKESVKKSRREYASLLGGMSDETREKVDYTTLRLPKRNEALSNNANVHMNCIIGENPDYSGKDIVFANMLNDLYLLPTLRNKKGAYGAYLSSDMENQRLFTYRDPNLEETFATFRSIPDYLRSAGISQETIDRYIIGSYSSLSRPMGKLTGVASSIQNSLLGITNATKLQWMKEAKSVNVQDVSAFADKMRKLLDEGILSTSGLSSLSKDSSLFDVQIHTDGTEEPLK